MTFIIPVDQKAKKKKETIKINSYLPIDSSCMLKKRNIPISVHTYICKMHMQGCN